MIYGLYYFRTTSFIDISHFSLGFYFDLLQICKNCIFLYLLEISFFWNWTQCINNFWYFLFFCGFMILVAINKKAWISVLVMYIKQERNSITFIPRKKFIFDYSGFTSGSRSNSPTLEGLSLRTKKLLFLSHFYFLSSIPNLIILWLHCSA